ncbi:MAG: hypothetical protein AAFN50_05115 [Pseudomonadota bacterium]
MSLDELSGRGNRSILVVHGRDFKPSKESYLDLSMAAMRSGLERDYPDCLDGFDLTHKQIAWYGDLNAEVLEAKGKRYDEDLDVGDRRNALAAMREITARKRFGIRQYDQLPGKSAVPEFVAGLLAPAASGVGLGGPLISAVSQDVARYFDRKLDFADAVRARLREKLCKLMDAGERIVLVAHGTGSVVAYDVLWQLSHDPDLKENYSEAKVELLITLGSPLGDSNIRRRLLGAKEKSAAKFPANVISWHNIAAEDDYTCHDNTLADDFKMMLQERLVSAVHDYKVFNLAVRYGKSNPHSSIGYYIHPRVSKIIADWLNTSSPQSSPRYTF